MPQSHATIVFPTRRISLSLPPSPLAHPTMCLSSPPKAIKSRTSSSDYLLSHPESKYQIPSIGARDLKQKDSVEATLNVLRIARMKAERKSANPLEINWVLMLFFKVRHFFNIHHSPSPPPPPPNTKKLYYFAFKTMPYNLFPLH